MTLNYIKMSPLTGMVGYGGGGTGLTLNAADKAPGWLGDRGCFAGGYEAGLTDDIDYITIASTGNAADFGNLTEVKMSVSAGSGEGRAIQPAGSNTNGNTRTLAIDYWTFANLGNASDFGDMVTMKGGLMTGSNGIRAIMSGGTNESNTDAAVNTMEYITIQTAGPATDFGDINTVLNTHMSVGNATRVFIVGGNGKTGAYGNNYKDERRYVTVDTAGNTTDFGDLDVPRWNMGGTGDATRAITLGGNATKSGSNVNTDDIRYFDMETSGSTSTFGNIDNGNTNDFWGGSGHGTCGNNDRGAFCGSEIDGNRVNNIDYIAIQTTGDSSDFGDLTGNKGYGVSHCAGT